MLTFDVRSPGPSIRRLAWSRLQIIHRWSARQRGACLGKGVSLIGQPQIDTFEGSEISVGDSCVLISKPSKTALGVNHPVVLRTLQVGARIAIGADVGISGGSICAAYSVVIGDGCLLGANVTISDTDFHLIESRSRRYAGLPVPLASDGVTIGRNVFIGTGSIILKGVTLGDDCVIGAGSVVTKSMPSGSICGGAPARIIRNWRHDGS